MLVISTGVEKVCLNFGKPNQRTLDSITIAEAKRFIAEGQFQAGSMLPKVEACVNFLEQGGRTAVITSPEKISAVLNGPAGTRLLA